MQVLAFCLHLLVFLLYLSLCFHFCFPSHKPLMQCSAVIFLYFFFPSSTGNLSTMVEEKEIERETQRERVKYNIFFFGFRDGYCGGQLNPVFKTALEEARPNIQSHMYKQRKEGPGPISSLRVKEYPRTTNKRIDKITLRGKVKSACEKFGHVRG